MNNSPATPSTTSPKLERIVQIKLVDTELRCTPNDKPIHGFDHEIEISPHITAHLTVPLSGHLSENSPWMALVIEYPNDMTGNDRSFLRELLPDLRFSETDHALASVLKTTCTEAYGTTPFSTLDAAQHVAHLRQIAPRIQNHPRIEMLDFEATERCAANLAATPTFLLDGAKPEILSKLSSLCELLIRQTSSLAVASSLHAIKSTIAVRLIPELPTVQKPITTGLLQRLTDRIAAIRKISWQPTYASSADRTWDIDTWRSGSGLLNEHAKLSVHSHIDGPPWIRVKVPLATATYNAASQLATLRSTGKQVDTNDPNLEALVVLTGDGGLYKRVKSNSAPLLETLYVEAHRNTPTGRELAAVAELVPTQEGRAWIGEATIPIHGEITELHWVVASRVGAEVANQLFGRWIRGLDLIALASVCDTADQQAAWRAASSYWLNTIGTKASGLETEHDVPLLTALVALLLTEHCCVTAHDERLDKLQTRIGALQQRVSPDTSKVANALVNDILRATPSLGTTVTDLFSRAAETVRMAFLNGTLGDDAPVAIQEIAQLIASSSIR
jgi:hypothetical protein